MPARTANRVPAKNVSVPNVSVPNTAARIQLTQGSLVSHRARREVLSQPTSVEATNPGSNATNPLVLKFPSLAEKSKPRKHHDPKMPGAGLEPDRENTGRNEGADTFHPKIHPTEDLATAELLEKWASMDLNSQAALLTMASQLAKTTQS